MSDLDTIRKRHGKYENVDLCYRCQDPWPCDTRVVLDALDMYERDSWYSEWCKARDDADRLASALRDLTHSERCGHRWCEVAREALRLHESKR